MSALRVRSAPPGVDGALVSITPESAGWTYVGFAVHHLAGRLERLEEERETCVVLLEGSCSLSGLGEASRASVFDGPPTALYVPPGAPWWAEGEGELAVCTAPARGGLEPRLLDSPELVTRGSGTEERFIANILMESEPAESLLVTEVITPAGHWSSFPPHKHDRDDPPRERALEETYYHRLRGGRGFAFQRVYTDDGLDEAVAAGDGDVVLVPRGYHPVAGDPRVDLYYLNVMAGPVREWRVSVAPGFD
ncbi:MAG TPA: 5-deoxy-glucuronate isomerase [Gaiellaceae bacterium]|jgi:5-deoxy-glucuronate isomerase|nr:5-deoxy-glucuronate isomerase [Gaiellaceae bacterium]